MTGSGTTLAEVLGAARNPSEAVPLLADLLARRRIAVLFGAGLSRDSGLPLAGELLERILIAAGATAAEVAVVRASGMPFEAFMEGVADHSVIQELWKVFERGAPNTNHEFLAKLMLREQLDQVYTTNFDRLLEMAFVAEGTTLAVVKAFPEATAMPPKADRVPTLVKLHGCVADASTIALSMRQVASRSVVASRARAVTTLFDTGPHDAVLLLGYSASDAFDILPILRSAEHPKPIVWVQHAETEPQTAALELDPRHLGSRVSGIALRCNTAWLVDAIAGQLGLSLRRHPVQPPCWQDAVDQWFERSRLTGGENFHQAVLGRALVDAMNPPAGLPHWEAAAAAIPSPPASVAHGVILRGLGATLAACGERKQGHHHLVQALLVFRAHSSKHEEAMCLCDIGQNHADAGVFQAALPAFLDGFEIARSIGNLSLMARHSLGVGGCYGSLNDARQAVGWLDKAVGFAEAAGDKTAEGTALVNAAIVHSEVGDHKSAQDRYDKGIHILEAAVGLDNALIRAAKRAFRSKT